MTEITDIDDIFHLEFIKFLDMGLYYDFVNIISILIWNFRMTESSHNAVILKKSDELRLNEIIARFGKSEPNCLRFGELMQLLLDRCIITNRISLSIAYNLFQQATHKRYSQPKK